MAPMGVYFDADLLRPGLLLLILRGSVQRRPDFLHEHAARVYWPEYALRDDEVPAPWIWPVRLCSGIDALIVQCGSGCRTEKKFCGSAVACFHQMSWAYPCLAVAGDLQWPADSAA
jgi:hypothetical protein